MTDKNTLEVINQIENLCEDSNQDEDRTEIQLTEQMQEIMKDFDILSVELDVNTTDKLQSYFVKNEKDKTSSEIGPSKTSIALYK